MTPDAHWQTAIRLAVAALGGLAVGIEREWSVKRGRHAPHFAGTRTFLLMGLLGALGAELMRSGFQAAAAALFVAAAALVVVAYAITSRREDVGGTTEIAALLVLVGGTLAGMGRLTEASALFAITTLVLAEKSRLHGFVEKIQSQELMAGARFAVLALVVFPLLPEGPFGPAPGLRPRELWMFALIFSGLSFVSFIALRVAGVGRGYGVVGLLGGLISSTAATFSFARQSRQHAQLAYLQAGGTIAACAVLPLRVVALLSLLDPALGAQAVPLMIPPCIAGFAASRLMLGRHRTHDAKIPPAANPLRFGAAVQMAAAFQLVLYLVHAVSERYGTQSVLVSSALVGMTDVDALLYSMIKLGTPDGPGLAAQAVAVGVVANTLFKTGVVLMVGRGAFRPIAAAGLSAIAAAGIAALWLLR
jgi:uncharacterized membrane protein (DUF4010 family)